MYKESASNIYIPATTKQVYPSVCLLSELVSRSSTSWEFFALLSPRRLSGKESALQCMKCRFNLWVRKILWRRKWLPAPVFLPEKSHGPGKLQSIGSQRVRHDSKLNSEQLSAYSKGCQYIWLWPFL